MRSPLFLLLSLSVSTCLSAADPELALRGRLRELGGNDPVAAASVEALGLSRSVRSDLAGRYALSLPAGWVELRVRADGFDEARLGLTLTAQSSSLPTLDLKRRALQGQAVIVRSRRESAPSRTPLKRKEIRRIAGIGRDPLRALQTLPGVVTPSDFSGQLAVRGGGPNDNQYLLNEVPWPVPFHYGGALSTVHSDLLERVDLYPAAFPARWGGVDGAILDAQSRPARRDGLHGQFDVNLLLSEALFEGPLGVASEPPPLSPTPQALSPTANALSPTAQPLSPTAELGLPAERKPWGAWLLSARRSYFELLLSGMGDRFTAVPSFWDVSLLGEADLSGVDKLRFTLLSTDDRLALMLKKEDVNNKDFQGEFSFRNYFGSVGLNWQRQLGDWRSTLTPYSSVTHAQQRFGAGYGIDIKPWVTGLKEDLRGPLGERQELSLGAQLEHQRYDVFGYIFRRSSGGGSGATTLSDPSGITISADANSAAAYLQDRVRVAPGLYFSLGARWQRSDRMGADSWDPRTALEWSPGPGTRLSAGWGYFSQFPSARELSDDFGNPRLGFSRTQHLVGGIEQQLGGPWSVKVEAYHKAYAERVIAVAGPQIYDNLGEGLARGAELLLKKEDDGHWFGWLSLSLAESWRLEPGQPWRRYAYDQPLTLSWVGSQTLTPAWSWGAKLNWHSGPLFTPVDHGVVDLNPNNLSGYAPVYGEPYSQRLEDYLRLDLRTDYAFRFRGWKLNLYAEVLNVLDRKNPAGVTYTKDYSRRGEDVNNLPRLPYIGLGAEF